MSQEAEKLAIRRFTSKKLQMNLEIISLKEHHMELEKHNKYLKYLIIHKKDDNGVQSPLEEIPINNPSKFTYWGVIIDLLFIYFVIIGSSVKIP